MPVEIAYIAIAIIAFGLILGILYIQRKKGWQETGRSKIGTIALSLVLVGLIFGNGRGWLGYALIGAGVILALIDLAMKLMGSNDN